MENIDQSDLNPDPHDPAGRAGENKWSIELNFSELESDLEVFLFLTKNKYRWQGLLVIFWLIINLPLLVYWFFNILFVAYIWLFVTVLPLAVYCSYLGTRSREWFWRKFAEANDMEYVEELSPKSLHGQLFQTGIVHSKTMNAIAGHTQSGQFIRLFYFRRNPPLGRIQSRSYKFTVLELEFDQTSFPHILLRNRSLNFQYSPQFNDAVEVSLEKKFSQKYKLHTQAGYEIEVLQIFNADTLEWFDQETKSLSIEFAQNKMYIYKNGLVSSKTELQEMLQAGELIINRLGGLLDRLEDDFEVLHHYYRE